MRGSWSASSGGVRRASPGFCDVATLEGYANAIEYYLGDHRRDLAVVGVFFLRAAGVRSGGDHSGRRGIVRMANYALWPFGRTVVEKPGAGAMSGLSNVMWFFVAGLWLAAGHIATAAAQAVTIIGIPLAIANVKMIPVTCFPFGKEIVSSR